MGQMVCSTPMVDVDSLSRQGRNLSNDKFNYNLLVPDRGLCREGVGRHHCYDYKSVVD